MTEWVKWMRGYVKIRVWGFAPQRFINLCSNKGILLWNIEKKEERYTMCVSLKAFWLLRPIARKTKVRVVISERYGLPFLVPEMVRRKAFLGGLCLALLFWWVSSLFVWDIQVTGNCRVTDDVFFQFLEAEGIQPGMPKHDLQIGELEKQIRRSFPQITWTSGRLDGTRLMIALKENDTGYATGQTENEDSSEQGTAKNLVAEYDGVVTGMIVRTGVPQTSVGAEVKKGDVLVAGKIPVYEEDGSVRTYHRVTADADIVLEHSGTFQIYLPADYVKKNYTGREKNSYFVRLWQKEWKQKKKVPYLQYDSMLYTYAVKPLEYFHLPCTIGKITYREYQKTEYQYTADEAKEILEKKILDFLESLDEKGVQIISKDVKIETRRAGWKVRGELTVREAVGILAEDSCTEEETPAGVETIDGNED